MSVDERTQAQEQHRRNWRVALLTAATLGLLLVLAFQLGRRSWLLPAGTTEIRAENERTSRVPGEAKDDHDTHAHDHAEPEEGVARFTPAALARAGIAIQTVRETKVRAHLPVTGVVEPNLQGVVEVTPRVSGKISSLRAGIGDHVGAGQVLATMTSTELAAAQANYRQASARVSAAEANLRRQRQLAAFGEFGQHKVQEARGNYNAAQGDLHEALAEIHAARSEVAEAMAAHVAARSQETTARSHVTVAEAAVEQARTQVEVTRSRFERQEALLKEELTSRQDWEQARADYQKAQADLKAAEAMVQSVRAGLDAATAKVQEAEAVVATRQARLEQAQAKRLAAVERLTIATEALKREEQVYRSGLLASKEVAEAEAVLRQAEIDRRAAADAVRLLGGTPGGGNTLAITAPLPGRVTRRTVTAGEMVSPEKPLFTLVNLKSVWVQLNVYSRDLPSVRVGLPVTVFTDAVPASKFVGKVDYISDVLDETTRTVKVRCVISNPDGLLKPQMFVRGQIETPLFRRAIAVPQEAVQTLEDRRVVFVPGDHPGEFQARRVQLGETVGDLVIVNQGLAAGERIVTRGAFIVKAQTMKSELGHEH